MKLTINISKDSVINEGVRFVIGNQEILLNSYESVFTIDNLKEGTHPFEIYTTSKSDVIEYILMWFFKLLILPINILLMNTDSDWYNSITPTALYMRGFITINGDTEILMKICSSTMTRGFIKRYQLDFITDAEISKSACKEELNRSSILWEMNKYLSRFFSFFVLGLSLLLFLTKNFPSAQKNVKKL